MTSSSHIKISICISTFSRADFIGATLETLVSQVTPDCEILVVDNASPDHTAEIVEKYLSRCQNFRYIREETNNGLDRNYNRAVGFARGEYCWLMSDDDHLKPGAIARVLEILREDLSLVVVNAELVDSSMSRTILPRYCDLESDQHYGTDEMDRLLSDLGPYAGFISSIVIKRAIWCERDRERYFGSLLIHVGVVYQRALPGRTRVISSPLIRFRFTQVHHWQSGMFEVEMLHWPRVVWSLAISDETKRKLSSPEPWKSFSGLMRFRAYGFYSMDEYKKYIAPKMKSSGMRLIPYIIAALPGLPMNLIYIAWYRLWNSKLELECLKTSRFHSS